jgi:hypothetical protein
MTTGRWRGDEIEKPNPRAEVRFFLEKREKR